IVQCLLFGDGGLSALGANFVNMGLIGAIGGYAIYAPIRRAIGGRAGVLLGGMTAAWFAVILAAGAFAVELAASGRWRDFPMVLGWMALIHAAIGVGEALITGLVLRSILLLRPDLIYQAALPPESRAARIGRCAVAGLAVAMAVAIFLAPVASDFPDGLEYVGAKLGFLKEEAQPVLDAPLADYGEGVRRWAIPGLDHVRVATAVAGVIGTLIVFGLGVGLARVFVGRTSEGLADAARSA
ncbi:MAG: PDGLE domain-containing protein, partial [Isosphaeraceae bacterium]|nr:PDGLE domain-containing protein [Isosphaeraceae bacterium]